MEKKAYITPALVSFQMTMADGILYSASNRNGDRVLGDGGSTDGTGITKGDTKSSGSWNVWSNDDE